jgi:hypothetical protein
MTGRRTFLKRGLLGGAVLLLGGGVGLSLHPSREVAAPREPLVTLPPSAFQVLVAIAGRVVVGEDADPVAIAHTVDQSLAAAAEETRSEVAQLLGLFENALAGLLFDGRARPFTRLEPEDRDRVLRAWRDSRLTLRRSGYQALRRMCLAAHYGRDEAWGPLGYPPPVKLPLAYDDSTAGSAVEDR